jgi:hypothetical protein
MRRAAILVVLAGCTSGELGSTDDTTDAASNDDTEIPTSDSSSPTDSSVTPDASTDSAAPTDSSAPFDGAPADLGDGGCAFAGSSIASTLTTTVVSGASASEAILAERPGGLVTAWRGGTGWQITPLDATGARAGSDIAIADALKVYGVAAGADGYAVLISRTPDYMTFVRISGAGAVVAKNDLVGGGDHTKVGVEWFGEFANTGRLVATGTGFAAYFGIHRRWPDMIGHQGDTLRTFTSAGAVESTVWDWGCSHSLDQRLDWNGKRLGPLCLSDCYPEKAIMFSNREANVSAEPSGNCAGGSSAALGAIVGDATGFVAAMLSKEGRTSRDAKVVRVGNDGKVSTTTWITTTPEDESDLHLARFGGSFLAAWSSGSSKKMQRIDTALSLIGSPETVSVPYPSQDFVSLASGDAAWATADGGKLTIVRAKACP